MIFGNEQFSGKDAVLFALNQSSFTFYLTGSRFFGGNSSTSDHDFYVDGSKDYVNLETFLRSIGFYLDFETEDSYTDDLIMAVFKHPEGVHVQIVRDIEAKTDVQNTLGASDVHYLGAKFTFGHAFTKDIRKYIWQVAVKSYLLAKSRLQVPSGILKNSDATRALHNLIRNVYPLKSQKIEAIKTIRQITGWGLKESKDFVESHNGTV